ncbi:MAG TPA: isoprenylcysteine carboxylmethyltransferase family protein [Steroidobacteraceae bacterium]|nr:isoprenylcysteine carboxylmethyltransferase family protein [Steroidobacteraceae bacterium]
MASMPLFAQLGLFLGISEMALTLWKRSGAGARRSDDGSLAVLWWAIMLMLGLAYFIAFKVPATRFHLPRELKWLALALFWGGLALRWWAIIYLGRFFTVDVAVQADHHLIDRGPYRYLRHPSYSGSFMSFVGLAIGFSNYLSGLVLMAGWVIGMTKRISVEERTLRGAFGERYDAYIARTWRLLPFVY